ncbi:MAG TPA: 1-acyl-sn-glycerol-3-phosphate acyltransferase [Actinomycetota bacterium]|nr:1-acyl-sn-glycerol-3-phosphate acyltransferase [Actinomycetota bacterium]
MNRLPPKILRRLVLAPLVILICAFLLVLSPLLLGGAAIYGAAFDRKLRVLRVLAFATVYLFFEIVSILAMLGLWIACGFGLGMRSQAMQSAHFGYMRWWLKCMNAAASRLFRLRIRIEDPPARKPGPVLVFSRHAGPGNSLMLVGTIMIGYRRLPRIVMLAKLQWDPFFDIVGNRLPNRFITHDPSDRDRSLRVIAELASGTPHDGAFVLFPEGRDFTVSLRTRAIASLRRKGHREEADKAEKMLRVLPPRHGGVMAAVNAAPEADVVFVAHTVLEDVGPFGELWRRIPFARPVAARYWRVPAAEVPREQEALIDWLYSWWARIDEWIDDKTDPDDKPSAVSSGSLGNPGEGGSTGS